jgi:hypothetical protein
MAQEWRPRSIIVVSAITRSPSTQSSGPAFLPRIGQAIMAHTRSLDPPHCFYNTIDAFSGCLYPQQPCYIFQPPLWKAINQRNRQNNQNPS